MAILVCVALSTVALAQTGTVHIINNTHGGSTVFYVGDNWTITITGAAPDALVDATANGVTWDFGYTNGSGNFSLSGYMSSGEVGNWSEVWRVGGTTAVPNPLTFTVYPAVAASCDSLTVGAVPPVMTSLDFIDSWSGYLYYQQLGSGTITGALNPAQYCVMYGDTWNIEWPIAGQRNILSPFLDQWVFQDSGSRPGDLTGFYPYFSYAAVGIIAVNLTNGNLYYRNGVISLYIDYTYW